MPMKFVALWVGCQYNVPSTPPWTVVQCEFVIHERVPPLVALKPRVQRKPGKLI